LTSGLEIKIGGFSHLVHASCKRGEDSLNFTITLNNNIEKHYPSFILKTPNLNIKVLGEHKLAKTLQHLILGKKKAMSLGESFAKKETYV
jgi:hypothetical protein